MTKLALLGCSGSDCDSLREATFHPSVEDILGLVLVLLLFGFMIRWYWRHFNQWSIGLRVSAAVLLMNMVALLFVIASRAFNLLY